MTQGLSKYLFTPTHFSVNCWNLLVLWSNPEYLVKRWQNFYIFLLENRHLFPRLHELPLFVAQIMDLPDSWKFLFVQLWRCEKNRFMDHHIEKLIKTVCSLNNSFFFNRNLVSMIKVFMNEVVSNAAPEDKVFFFKWLLEQKQMSKRIFHA